MLVEHTKKNDIYVVEYITNECSTKRIEYVSKDAMKRGVEELLNYGIAREVYIYSLIAWYDIHDVDNVRREL